MSDIRDQSVSLTFSLNKVDMYQIDFVNDLNASLEQLLSLLQHYFILCYIIHSMKNCK